MLRVRHFQNGFWGVLAVVFRHARILAGGAGGLGGEGGWSAAKKRRKKDLQCVRL